MTQLTQGSDMEEPIDPIRVFSIKLTTAVFVTGEVPEKLYEWENELEQAFEADKQRSIDRATAEARIDELKQMPNHTSVNLHVRDRIAELEQQLSPTTKKGGEDGKD